MRACPACGAYVRGPAACPHCGSSSLGRAAAALLLGLSVAGCPAPTTEVDQRRPEDEPIQALYGVVDFGDAALPAPPPSPDAQTPTATPEAVAPTPSEGDPAP